MALKPLPKAIMIAAVVGVVAFAGTKFLPDSKPEAPAPVVAAPTVVTPPTQAQVEAAATAGASDTVAPQERVDSQPLAPAPEAPKHNVTSGDAGLNAVLGAGR